METLSTNYYVRRQQEVEKKIDTNKQFFLKTWDA